MHFFLDFIIEHAALLKKVHSVQQNICCVELRKTFCCNFLVEFLDFLLDALSLLLSVLHLVVRTLRFFFVSLQFCQNRVSFNFESVLVFPDIFELSLLVNLSEGTEQRVLHDNLNDRSNFSVEIEKIICANLSSNVNTRFFLNEMRRRRSLDVCLGCCSDVVLNWAVNDVN